MRIDYQIEGSFALITRLIDYAELWFEVIKREDAEPFEVIKREDVEPFEVIKRESGEPFEVI
jgi:hypothetical protein